MNRGRLWGLPYEHQTQGEVLDFLMQLRQRYPEDQRLYVVLDNRSAHTTLAIVDWVRRHKKSLVLTPTYRSFLNRINCQFTALKTFTLGGAYHLNHAAQFAAILRYVIYRNQQTVKPVAHSRDIRVNLS